MYNMYLLKGVSQVQYFSIARVTQAAQMTAGELNFAYYIYIHTYSRKHFLNQWNGKYIFIIYYMYLYLLLFFFFKFYFLL